MPKQHTVTSYQFDELSDKAKEVARDWFRDGNLDYDWWSSTYEDAARIGLKIEGFDLGRGAKVDGKFVIFAVDVARRIAKDHGEGCETRKLADEFLASIKGDGPTDEQEEDFLTNVRCAYWDILNTESEYLQSDECVDESIRANEYDFTVDGRRFRY